MKAYIVVINNTATKRQQAAAILTVFVGLSVKVSAVVNSDCYKFKSCVKLGVINRTIKWKNQKHG